MSERMKFLLLFIFLLGLMALVWSVASSGIAAGG